MCQVCCSDRAQSPDRTDWPTDLVSIGLVFVRAGLSGVVLSSQLHMTPNRLGAKRG